MRPLPVFVLALIGFSLACAAPGSEGDKEGGGGGDVTVTGPDDVVLDDLEDGLVIDIEGGVAAGWLFGVVRVDSEEGEACIDGGDVCHTLEPDGGELEWVSDCADAEDGATCISRAYWRMGILTYVLKPTVGTGCWTWGSDPEYYTESLGCTVTEWEDDSY